MAFEHYIRSGQKLLRCGYTTGTCAALAARALLSGCVPETVSLKTPRGLIVEVVPSFRRMEDENTAVCAVRKDAGDDADVTDGIIIVATARRCDTPGVAIGGGPGVGHVTRPGLDQPVGAAAINSTPRRMIEEQVLAVCAEFGYVGGVEVIISVPGGDEAAKRTFNPHLGVEGGISILGTSGIVEPMSEQALVDTIELELKQSAAHSSRLILTPGNYGADFLRARDWDVLGVPVVKCSNFIGEALDATAGLPISEVLLVGHIGKLVKLAGGVMNTHSKYADCRTELLCAHAALCGAERQLCRCLMASATTDACIELLDRAGLRREVLSSLLESIQTHLDRRVHGAYRIGAVLFSNQYGLLGSTGNAKDILAQWGLSGG